MLLIQLFCLVAESMSLRGGGVGGAGFLLIGTVVVVVFSFKLPVLLLLL
jgi:hypothetical protein